MGTTRINTGIHPSSIKVCKTFMRRFDPGPRLQIYPDRINTIASSTPKAREMSTKG
jgi:hypothetical protein